MPHWLFGGIRASEASASAVAATGASGGGYGADPIDGDHGFTQMGVGRREVPTWTTEKARTFSIASYRSNPMARAIIDTYVSFGVGDSGCAVLCQDPAVRAVVDAWWNDPRNRFEELAPRIMRDWMLTGEFIPEYLVGPLTGVVRWSPIDPAMVADVEIDRGNALWYKTLNIKNAGGTTTPKEIAQVSDLSGLRTGQVGFFPGWQALLTDRRGQPFLTPILDELDAYSQVLGNLIDRTAIARYLVLDVTVKGGQKEVDAFIAARGGQHVPPSGSIEVHNDAVTWKALDVKTGSAEDSITLGATLTNIAGGAGLAKTWLADAEDANRATSISMAEPVRRRVGGVQRDFLAILTEMARYTVDRAVAAGRLAPTVEMRNVAGDVVRVPAAETVRVTGPEIAASDSQVTAAVFLNLSQALDHMVASGALSKAAAALAAQKAWEQFVGQPFRPDLAVVDTDDEAVDPDGDSGDGSGKAAASGKRALSVAETIQKVYLGVGKIVTSDEARKVVNEAGGNLPVPGPTFDVDTPGAAPVPIRPDLQLAE